MDLREKLEYDLARVREIVDAGLDAGVADSPVLRTASRLIREYKAALRMLDEQEAAVLDLLSERSGR